LSKRHEKKISYMTAAADVEARAAAHSKLEGVSGKEDKLAAAEEALTHAQVKEQKIIGGNVLWRIFRSTFF
jgi:hypothetical protein